MVVAKRYEPRHIERLRAAFPDVRFLQVLREGEAPSDAGNAEVLFTCAMTRNALSSVIRGLPKLRWIHSCGAGFDQVDVPEVAERGLLVTRSAESHNAAIGEYVLGAILMMAKRFPEFMRNQPERRWRRRGSDQGMGEIAGRTVGIVGVGAVGREIAVRCRAMGMRVLGVRRTAGTVDGFDVVYARDDLPRMLHESDYVVLAVPLTPETRQLIGERELRQMREHAYLINVARGEVVVEPELVRALQEGAIAGLCSDVFEVEPLPDDSPLWDMPNVVITPHCASDSPATVDRGVGEFEENLTRFLKGEPLRGVVDTARGY